MPPYYSLLPATPAQHQSLFWPTGWPIEIVVVHAFHFGHRPIQARDADDMGYGYIDESQQKPLRGRELVGTIIGCIIGTAVAVWILYYCWKHGGPKATYYETAIQMKETRAKYRCWKVGRCLQCPSRQITSTHWVEPPVAVDDPARPERILLYSSRL